MIHRRHNDFMGNWFKTNLTDSSRVVFVADCVGARFGAVYRPIHTIPGVLKDLEKFCLEVIVQKRSKTEAR